MPVKRAPVAAPACPRCAERDGLRTRYARELSAKTQEVTMTATVRKPEKPHLVDQATICELFRVSDQSIRNYMRRGMRVHGTRRRPLYQVGEVSNWTMYAKHLRRNGHDAEHIDQFTADQWVMRAEQERHGPGWFVLIPLDVDHPQRNELLRIAAEGRRWAPTDRELEDMYGAETAHTHHHEPNEEDE
jgi:hypothetical protein